VVAKGPEHAPHPHGISVFEDQVFFSDQTRMALFKASKYDNAANKVNLYTDSLKSILTVRVVHPMRQQTCMF
jgi:hypothetical protein